MEQEDKKSPNEQRIRKLTSLYYSRKEIQKAIFDFSKNRETVPRYFEGFGKRPDSLQYQGDVFELVKKGATSFHCSEEIWRDPLQISTDLKPKQINELRIGWDLLLDIDSKYLDYSKILAKIILKVLGFYGVKNVGVKFSGSRGFHMIVPEKAFPKEIYGTKTSDKFPEWPRIITQFIEETCKKDLIKDITKTIDDKKYGSVKKYIKGDEKSGDFVKKVMPDLILVSPRHLFRAPYSLHEKTALASVVLTKDEIDNFQPRDADPLKVKVRNFIPNMELGEASELLREALDWYKNKHPDEAQNNQDKEKFDREFKPVELKNISEELFPPSIKKILQGVNDGRKRAVFILLNFFRSIGMDRKDVEKNLYKWNEKNEVPLKEGYIKSQLSWAYRNKPVPPPNYDKDYYKGIGINPTEEEIRYKNPSNYMVKKTFQRNSSERKQKNKK